MRRILTVALVALAAIAVVSMVQAADKKTIKEVMKAAHVGGNNSLLFKVAGGKGEKEDAEKLLGLYKDLSANTPPQGEEKNWKEMTEKIAKAADLVVKGEKGAGAELKKAVNCKNCHDEHRPKK